MNLLALIVLVLFCLQQKIVQFAGQLTTSRVNPRINNRAIITFLALAFALLFFWPNWIELNGDGFTDRVNYTFSYNSGWMLYRYLQMGWMDFFLREGLWFFILDSLVQTTGNLEAAFYIISAFTVFAAAYFVLRVTRQPICLLMLVNPAFVDFVMGQLRSCLAAGVFLIALTLPRPARYALFAACVAIHTSFIIFIVIYASYWVITALLDSDVQRAFFRTVDERMLIWLAVVSMAVVAGFAQGTVLEALDDRRAYSEFISSGWLLTLAWMSFAILYGALKRRYGLGGYFYIFCASLFMVATWQGQYGSRFVAVGLPFLAVAAGEFDGDWKQHVLIGSFAGFSLIYFVLYWLG